MSAEIHADHGDFVTVNVMHTPTFDPVETDAAVVALREVFRGADKATRQQLVPILPPAEIAFAGIRMYVDPRDNYTDRCIWAEGQPPEMKSLMALVALIEGRNAFVLDIGANSGAYAVPLAMAAGKGSRVIAVEPNPAMIGRLGHNLHLNGLAGSVRIESCAIGAEAGEAVLNLRARNHGQASLRPIEDRKRDGGVLVPVRPLSDFVSGAGEHDVSVLKIDVEGAEADALAPLLDAGGWLPDAILIETAHAAVWSVDLVKKIEALGFVTTLEAEGNTLFVKSGTA